MLNNKEDWVFFGIKKKKEKHAEKKEKRENVCKMFTLELH